MKNKKRLIELLISVFLIIKFLFIDNISSCFAAPVMIEGDAEALIVLANTEYFNNKPVLIYAEQLSDRQTATLLLDNINDFVFQDSIWEDLAIDFEFYAVTVSSKFAVNISSKESFELWVDSSFCDLDWLKNSSYLINIDGHSIINDSRLDDYVFQRKYIKIGEFILEKGHHDFLISSDSSFVKIEPVRLFLVSKEKRIKAQIKILDKLNKKNVNSTYIFNKEKAEFWIH
ncbi:MAG: hypothetical protein KJ915_02915 [Candidatus Omnitrophica bacterium]|nr:hypothetical protein [Candidatus Omnitrophota bacterium]